MDTNTFQYLLQAATRHENSSISLAITIQIATAVITVVGLILNYLKSKSADEGTKQSNQKLDKAEPVREAIHKAVNGDRKALEVKAVALNEKLADMSKDLAVLQEQKTTAEKAALAVVPTVPVLTEELIRRIVAEVRATDKPKTQE